MSTPTIRRNACILHLGLVLTLGLITFIGSLLPIGLTRLTGVALAQGPTSRYVASTGDDSSNDCNSSSAPCATIQHAVDMADPGDEILVATGIYTRAQARPRSDLVSARVVTQVVYISQTITIRGGYTTTNWITPDPVANPTTLDAQEQGRGLYIAGNISATIEGLRITRGNAELGSGISAGGGGINIISTTVTLRNNQIFGNVANVGGGLSFGNSLGAMLINNTVSENRTSGQLPQGGGLFFFNSPGATLIGNTIISNTATLTGGVKSGGGLVFLFSDDVTLTSNVIRGNLAANAGGGLSCWQCNNIRLTDNIISDNVSGDGGGLLFRESTNIRLSNNIIRDNVSSQGSGLYLNQSTGILTNNIIADNQTDLIGSGAGIGLYITDSSLHLLHTTIARNGGASGVYVTNSGFGTSSVSLTNTILVSHSAGITVTNRGTASLNGVLWDSNTTNTGGDGTVSVTNEYTGSPAFAADGYHLTDSSAAIDRGVNAGVNDDIDGDPRPFRLGYDLGADEFSAALEVTKQVEPDLVQAGRQLTYTIRVTNTGSVDLHATITDTLPPQVTPNEPLVWTPTITEPGGVWIGQFTVMVQPGYSGLLTNVVQVTTEEGVTGEYIATSEAIERSVYLPLILRAPAAFSHPIGDVIPARPVADQGETFFSTSVQIPAALPVGGRFYFSSQPDAVAEVLVDDELAVLLDGTDVFTYDFSTGDRPEPATVEIPRATMEQLAGETVRVEYRDVYGYIVEASAIWLIWTP